MQAAFDTVLKTALRHTTVYTLHNRTATDRVIPIEHSRNSTWKLLSPAKADEQTIQLNVFEVLADRDDSYGALNSNSVTRFNTELAKLPVPEVIGLRGHEAEPVRAIRT